MPVQPPPRGCCHPPALSTISPSPLEAETVFAPWLHDWLESAISVHPGCRPVSALKMHPLAATRRGGGGGRAAAACGHRADDDGACRSAPAPGPAVSARPPSREAQPNKQQIVKGLLPTACRPPPLLGADRHVADRELMKTRGQPAMCACRRGVHASVFELLAPVFRNRLHPAIGDRQRFSRLLGDAPCACRCRSEKSPIRA